jgi:hypothetical protein
VKQQPNNDRQQNPGRTVDQKNIDGKNNVIVGIGGNTGDIHIGPIGDNSVPQPLRVDYSIEQTPVLLWGKSIHIPTVEKYTFWVGCFAVLGVLANLFGVLGFFGVSGKDFMTTLTPLVLPVAFFGGLALMFWISFHFLREGRLQTLFGNWMMQGDANQGLTVGELCATCPICTGKLNLKPLFKGSNKLVGKCQKYPEDHIFSFDPATMSGSECQITHWYPGR